MVKGEIVGGEVLLLSALCQPKYLKSFWPQCLFIYVILGSSYVHIRVLFSIAALWCKSDHHENMEIILLSTQDRIRGILLTYPEFHVADLHCTARHVGHGWEHGNHLFCVTLGIGSPVKRQGQGCLAILHFILGILLPLWLYLAMVAQVSSWSPWIYSQVFAMSLACCTGGHSNPLSPRPLASTGSTLPLHYPHLSPTPRLRNPPL